MKIALIWAKGYDTNYGIPLPLGYLKSNLDNSKHDIRIFDCAFANKDADSPELKEFINNFQPDIVGVSCWSMVYFEGLRILKLVKSMNNKIITVMGGAHVTTYPDKAIKEDTIDFIFRGEAEISFRKFIEEVESNNPNFSNISGLVYTTPNGEVIKNKINYETDIDKIKIPDYNAINLQGYIAKGYRFNTVHKYNAPVWATRGCPYACAFCSASIQNGRSIRKHSIGYLVNWIKYLYEKQGIRHISIIDDNFSFDVEYAKEFCRAILILKLKDLSLGTPNGLRAERIDDELLNLMKQAGWENVIIAPESGSKNTLKRMKKNMDPNTIPQKIKQIKKAGFKVHGFFIIGYPGETEQDIKETITLLRKCNFNFFFLNNFQPLPGTEIYNELIEKGEIEEGLLPKNYSDGERAYYPQALKGFNFPRTILKEYMRLALTHPLNIPYMFKIINPKLIAYKIYKNIRSMQK